MAHTPELTTRTDAGPDGRRILVVEDDFDIRDTLTHVLSDAGYEVVCASNGSEALALLRDGATYALILLDLMMPVMDGRTFLAARQSEARAASIPVVVFSADASLDAAAAGYAAGVLRKPIQLEALLDAVSRYSGPA